MCPEIDMINIISVCLQLHSEYTDVALEKVLPIKMIHSHVEADSIILIKVYMTSNKVRSP